MKRKRPFRIAVRALVLFVTLAGGVIGCAKKQTVVDGEVTPPPRESGVTVMITPAGIPDAAQFTLKLSKGNRPDANHMRWKNDSGQKITIHFKSGWPFMEPVGDVVIESGASSEWFTLSPTATDGAVYDYNLDPNIITNSGGPSDPSVSSEP